MQKRTFLKISSAVVTGSVFSSFVGCKQDDKLYNWARNYEYSTDSFHYPETVEQVQEIVKRCRKLRAIGTRHAFNGMADSTENIISLRNFDQFTLDKESHKVTVGAGVRYGELSEYLHKNGFALHNLASLPHISVAGACATATHGSGVKNGNLSTAVDAMEIITADGNLLVLSREKDADQFLGSVVHLGGLGVVTKLTLNIQPTFNMRQDVYQNLPMASLKENLDDILSIGNSVSLFTDWKNHNINQVWVKSKIENNQNSGQIKNDFFEATPATRNIHPIIEISAENCTEQLGVAGPWYERMPHFRMNFTPSSGEELQSEYFVPRHDAYEAIRAIDQLSEIITPHLQITEIRTIAADDLWMSPCYKQECLAIHFTWKKDWPAVSKLLPVIEERLAPFNGRPHWAKLFTTSPARLKSVYERLPDFSELLMQHDPQGKFRNDYLDRNIFGS